MTTATKTFAVYRIANAKGTGPQPRTADLTENGVIVGRITRGAVRRGFVPPYEVKFLSTQAERRFTAWGCEVLSLSEAVEALFAK